MTTFELEEYLAAHSQIVDNFRDKYAAFLNEQNADRPTNKKWSSLRIKNETSSAVIKFISNIQAKLSSAMKPVSKNLMMAGLIIWNAMKSSIAWKSP